MSRVIASSSRLDLARNTFARSLLYFHHGLLVSRLRSPLHISASNRRRWQGGPTMEYREYSEEDQRRQRRREPARYATDFGDGTLALAFAFKIP